MRKLIESTHVALGGEIGSPDWRVGCPDTSDGRTAMSGARLGVVLTSSLIYVSAPGSIADYGRSLNTANDERDRAETVIPAPEKRKVGGSTPAPDHQLAY